MISNGRHSLPPAEFPGQERFDFTFALMAGGYAEGEWGHGFLLGQLSVNRVTGDVSAVHFENRAGDELAARQQERGVRDLPWLTDTIEKV